MFTVYHVKEIWPVDCTDKFNIFGDAKHLNQIILDPLSGSCLKEYNKIFNS